MRERLVRSLVIGGIGGFVLLVGLVLIASFWVQRRPVDAALAWIDGEPTLQALSERFPRRAANGTALRLEELVRPLGIDLTPRWRGEHPRPVDPAVSRFGEIRQTLVKYLAAEIGRDRPRVEPPPEDLAGYLEEFRARLIELRDELRSAEAPYWELEMDRLFEAPIPNLLGNLNLHRLLLVEALAAAARGESAAALEGVEASWQLSRSVREDPILITQMIAMAVLRLQAGVLRHLDDVPVSWQQRLAEHDPRRSLLVALSLEGWIWTQVDDPAIMMSANSRRWDRVVYAVARPYVRACLADVSERWRRGVARLAHSGALCDASFTAEPFDLTMKVPRWNMIGGTVAPDLGAVARRLAQLELDLELTLKVLELKRGPVALAQFGRSEACPRDSWLYTVDADGAATSVALDRQVEWDDLRGAKMPLRYFSTPAH